VIWAGTTNGLVQLTADGGKSWRDVSPPGLTRFHQVSTIEASRFDSATAFIAVEAHEANDFAPHVFRTTDAGKSWRETVAGIAAGDVVRVVREDPVRRGLLYAGTENGALVSFDAGDHWQSLQLNLPVVSVRDIVVHDQDVLICTYGRAIWILDDVSPLRQANGSISEADAFLFLPHQAIRVRRNDNNDTPMPPDLPAAKNPPTGAVIDYYLKAAARDITVGIYDDRGELVRQLSSVADRAPEGEPPNVPSYWLATPNPLSTAAGASRAVWDLRYPPPPALRHDYPISATVGQTPQTPEGPLAAPGKYEVRLTANGRTLRQPLTIVADPRVRVSQADFDRQAMFERRIAAAMGSAYENYEQVVAVRKAAAAHAQDVDALKAFDRSAAALIGQQLRGGNRSATGAGRPPSDFASLNGNLSALLDASGLADGAPTEPMKSAWADYCRDLTAAVQRWSELTTKELPAVNAQLRQLSLPALAAAAPPVAAPSCVP
jgi:hypothetical protein